jgi:hypothetical protein
MMENTWENAHLIDTPNGKIVKIHFANSAERLAWALEGTEEACGMPTWFRVMVFQPKYARTLGLAPEN